MDGGDECILKHSKKDGMCWMEWTYLLSKQQNGIALTG